MDSANVDPEAEKGKPKIIEGMQLSPDIIISGHHMDVVYFIQFWPVMSSCGKCGGCCDYPPICSSDE